MQSDFQLTKSQLADIIAKQKRDKEKLEQQINSMYDFVHKNFDPLLDAFDEITSTPEGTELLKKLQDKKQANIEEDKLLVP